MGGYCIIADDLTGANAAGMLLKKGGLKSCISIKNECDILNIGKKYNAVICSTDSRNLSAEEAYRLVKIYAEQFEKTDFVLITKRIDSTLRGNVGIEIDAILDTLGEAYIMAVVPSFPEAGRTVKMGQLYVDGTLLASTEAADDPIMPVKCSDIKMLIEKQSRYAATNIYLSSLRAMDKILMRDIKQKISEGNRILIFDAESENDLKLIAEALIKLKIKYAAADPGPFTAYVASRQTRERKTAKILIAIGSVNPVTCRQVEVFQKVYGESVCVLAETKKFVCGNSDKEKEIRRIVNECLKIYDQGNIAAVIGDGIYDDKRFDLFATDTEGKKDKSAMAVGINDAFAEIVERIVMGEKRVKNLFLSGGDIVAAVFKKMETEVMVPLEEVFPLAVYGIISGGKLEKKGVLTKGGMAGGTHSLVECIRYLESER